MTTAPPDAFAFDHVLFYGREYEEVLSMLLIEESDLADKKVLDCPSGPDAFVAEAHRRGHDVTGCDPLYAKPLAEILSQGDQDIRAAWTSSKLHSDQMGGLDLDAFHGRKLRALQQFGADFEAGRAAGRYREASLPHLPFADKTFDLVLSANLLFAYSSTAIGGISIGDTFDLEFHRQSVRELIRVCRGEVRLYPVMTHTKKKHLHPYAAQIIGQLAADGVPIELRQTSYDQASATGHLVLVIDCDGRA